MVSKLYSQNWKKHCDLHSGYFTKVAAGVSCMATINVAVRVAHGKKEMETKLAFTLDLCLELLICHIYVWSSRVKTKLKSWSHWQRW